MTSATISSTDTRKTLKRLRRTATIARQLMRDHVEEEGGTNATVGACALLDLIRSGLGEVLKRQAAEDDQGDENPPCAEVVEDEPAVTFEPTTRLQHLMGLALIGFRIGHVALLDLSDHLADHECEEGESGCELCHMAEISDDRATVSNRIYQDVRNYMPVSPHREEAMTAEARERLDGVLAGIRLPRRTRMLEESIRRG